MTFFSTLPFFRSSVTFLLYGILVNDKTMILVNLFGTAINICYICFYYVYTNEVPAKTVVWAQFGYAGAFLMAVFAYTYIENPEVLKFRYGILLTLVLFYFVGTPLLGLVCFSFSVFICYHCNCNFDLLTPISQLIQHNKFGFVFSSIQGEIIKKKSTEGLPFPIILAGTAVSVMWFLYGVVARENFMIFQNGVLSIMSVIQLSMFAIYPSKPAAKKSPKKKTN